MAWYRDHDEQRKEFRMRVEGGVEFRWRDGRSGHGELVDLSAGGVQFTTEAAIAEGEQLRIRVPSSDNRIPALTGVAVVVRVARSEGRNSVACRLKPDATPGPS